MLLPVSPGPTWDLLGMRRGEIPPAASALVLNVTGDIGSLEAH